MELTNEVILQMHTENETFLSRFISYFDGEKDPRNLMVVFSILTVVMTEWDISSCIQVRRS
jgi:DNA repair/transcription protein MET18/MMS19